MADVVQSIVTALIEATAQPVSHSITSDNAYHLFRVGKGANGVITKWVPIDAKPADIPDIVADTLEALKDLKDSTYG